MSETNAGEVSTLNFGLVNIYSFRPHVEHLYYLSKLLADGGHSIYFLTCDSSVETCYIRLLKDSSRVAECAKCILGGVRSFPSSDITSIGKHPSPLSEKELDELVLSSSCTLRRTESEREWNDEDVVAFRGQLRRPAASAFESARNWIQQNGLDAVICFNGRMDLTRSVTYACENLGVPYITHERTWFGDGLRLIPNANCLSIKEMGRLVEEFSDKPLKREQASFAGKMIGERFLQRNSLEWRVYNENAEPAPWPTRTTGPRVLVAPSSKNEFAGHSEWRSAWPSNTEALDDFFNVFGIQPEQVVVRCHPNWAENIGRVSGNRSLVHYVQWAESRGIHLIGSAEKASTYDLIQQADIVILNGGSSAIEAGACGKQVVCLGPSGYEFAGFVQTFKTREGMLAKGLRELPADAVRRKTLRYVYVRSHRFPQFVDFVKALETTRYKYYRGADAGRIVRMFETGEIEADDPSYADTTEYEDDVVTNLVEQNWAALANYSPLENRGDELLIQRRNGFRWIDTARARFKRGDR